jgi:putative ABC transport system ATP-binding protein
MIETSTPLHFAYPSGGFTLRLSGFHAQSGETVAVVGPSGSGKTTLLSLLSGILVPQSGSAKVDGVVVSDLDEPQRRAFRLTKIGQVFQRVDLLDYLTVEENILLPVLLTGQGVSPERRDRAHDLLKRVGLADKSRRLPGALSQGERQRVGICRALIAKPPVVLADEPTSSLDAASAQSALDLFFSLVKEEGATLVCLTHDSSILPRFDRVVRMSDLTQTTQPTPDDPQGRGCNISTAA